jgi:Bacterial type III secretion protein (HrpB4)
MSGIDDTCIDTAELDTGNHGAVAPDSLPIDVVRRLIQYHAHRRTLFAWIHAERLAGISAANHLPDLREGQPADLAEAFLDAVGMPPAPLDSFVCAGAELALLPVPDCLRVFRLRALFDYDVVRSWIDKPRRTHLHDWVGPHGARLLQAQRRNLGGRESAVDLFAEAAVLGPESAATLAWRGFRLFARDCGWPACGPFSLIPLALPESVTRACSPQDDAIVRQPALSADRCPSMSIVSQLPQLFPEWTW